MAENMTGDIISDHRERMLNLKKYYPFFRLIDTSFSNFKDGKYEILDMGYIVMAVLRFFIEENNFKEKDVTYPEYLDFLRLILKRDFGLDLNEQDSKEIADYIFDKIKNDGRPFEFSYFDDIDDALIEGLEQNQDFFSLLLSNDEIKKQVLGIFTEEIYKSLRKA